MRKICNIWKTNAILIIICTKLYIVLAMSLPDVGLWAKTQLKKAGILKDPARSEPTPTTEAADPRTAACNKF